MHRSTITQVVISLAALINGVACKPELTPYVPLRIVTSQLPDAVAGVRYEFSLESFGGQPPIQWSLANKPGSLAWLTVDPATGKLSSTDTPQAPQAEASFTIRATDARGEPAEKLMVLEVIGCHEAETSVCFRLDPATGECQQSSVLCHNGVFPECGSGPLSNDLDHCGPAPSGSSCGACGSSGDSCNGVCKCGGGAGCKDASPDCCGGSCTNLQTDLKNCGSCGNACPTPTRPHADATCTNGVCGDVCDAGLTDCGGACENLASDPAHCGACGQACGAATPNCANGSCTNFLTDLNNCGGTGHVCPASTRAGAHVTCTNGICGDACNAGLTDCGGSCADPGSNSAHCGACGRSCGAATPNCANGSCTNFLTDLNNCGGTGHVCPAPTRAGAHAICANGTCGDACNTGLTDCSGSCVNLRSSEEHCGSCRNSCDGRDRCENGVCKCVGGREQC